MVQVFSTKISPPSSALNSASKPQTKQVFDIKPALKPTGWGKRHTLGILGFWAFAMSYAMRVDLSISIVAMVHGTGQKPAQNVTHQQPTQFPKGSRSNHASPKNITVKGAIGNGTIINDGEFHWDSVQQGIILGAFFWGYVVTQLPGGILAKRYGGKWTLGMGLFITGVSTILTPVLARVHVNLLIFARVVQGLGEGVTSPAMHALLAAWAPPNERSILGSATFAGTQFGTAVTMVISGFLIQAGVLGGWPSIFYLIGGFTLVWFVFWMIMIQDSPAEHTSISKEEREYIERSIGEGNGKVDNVRSTPWSQIFKSVPFWALIISHVGHGYGLYTVMTLLPTYLKTALHFDIKKNSLINAFPSLVQWIVAIATTQLSDALISRGILRTVTIRKGNMVIGHFGSAIALIAASYSGHDRNLAVALLTVAVGLNGATFGGYLVNHVDLSPNWASILLGITNTFATLTGFMAPYIAGLLIKNDPSIKNWQYVFFITAAIYVVGVLVYVLFASGSEQPWNRPQSPNKIKPPPILPSPDQQFEDDDIADHILIIRKKF